MSIAARAGRRSVLLVIALAFGIASTLVLSSTETLAQQGSVGTLRDGGVLRLQLGGTDQFLFEPPSGSSTAQSIGVTNGCRLNPTTGALVALSPEPSGSVGFVQDAIGVRGPGEGNGQNCGRIDGNQELVMDLVQTDGSPLEGKVIDFAEIDLELKFDAEVRITGYIVDADGDATQVGEPLTFSAGDSDSGPDSASLDNYRIRFPDVGTTAVNRLVFDLVGDTGGASLEGGADGTEACDTDDSAACDPGLGETIDDDPEAEPPVDTTTGDTLFHLVEADGVLDCGDVAPIEGGAGGTPASTLERLENTFIIPDPEDPDPEPEPEACVPIPYNQETGPGVQSCNFESPSPQCVLLEKDLLGQDAQFFWSVTWADETGTWPERVTQFDYNFDGLFTDIQLCLADDGSAIGDDDDAFPELPDTAVLGDGNAKDPWCLIDSRTVLDFETGLVNVLETYYGGGDPTGRRP